ncbi:MAG TPA: hypothetical protein VFW65_10780 [Pseudonocardiaceae bacterium]|nr:hypothetical protein [Pseudonocardiaceae bacterium]
MDVRTIDQNYEQLREQSQRTVQAITNLAQKLQVAASDGDQQARAWLLDLKELTLGVQQEQNQVALLLQSIHNYVANQAQQPIYQQAQPPYPPPYPQPPMYQQPMYAGGGFGGFLGGGFGQAIATGAGFAIGEDIIDDLFF